MMVSPGLEGPAVHTANGGQRKMWKLTMTKTIKILSLLLMLMGIAGCDSKVEDGAAVKTMEQAVVAEKPEVSPADYETNEIAYGRFVPERDDDFAWENDKVAFRVYGPASQGKGQVSGVDAWLKKVSYPIIDKWYAGHLAGTSYHEDHGEGYDPYHVGDSRGVGGTAIWVEGTPWPAGKFKTYEVLQSGGDVVEFKLTYEWETPLGVVTETKTISLAIGQQLYRVSSLFTLDGKPASLPVAIGLATHDEKAQVFSHPESGRISTWEVIDGQGLGTGALINPGAVSEIIHAPSEEKDRSHIWLITSANEEGELGYSAGFAWQAAGEITSVEQWNEYLDSSDGK